MFVLFAALAGPAVAKRIMGTSGPDKLWGTAHADVIRTLGGDDRAAGRGGKDRIKGGAGADRVIGGRGKDRLNGNGGNDALNAVDGRRDRVINGGGGDNSCKLDSADLPIAVGCATITVVGGGTGAGAPLNLTSASGLTCVSSLPTCMFTLNGDGADTLIGTVTGGGGVTLALGAGVDVSGSAWTATGVYGCTSDGYLRVTIGGESLDVPITCRSS